MAGEFQTALHTPQQACSPGPIVSNQSIFPVGFIGIAGAKVNA
jgi:hypothetical protein